MGGRKRVGHGASTPGAGCTPEPLIISFLGLLKQSAESRLDTTEIHSLAATEDGSPESKESAGLVLSDTCLLRGDPGFVDTSLPSLPLIHHVLLCVTLCLLSSSDKDTSHSGSRVYPTAV